MKIKNSITAYLIALCGILTPAFAQAATPVMGAERLQLLTSLVADTRVGLLVNHTSIVGDRQTHLLDTLLALGVNVVKIYAPEHGFRGNEDAGATVNDERDPRTGLPIVSLYGRNRKPTAAQLADIDVIVFDIQDVGTRFFTYISTMHYAMEACAETGKRFIVCDRPNPNDFVDGPMRRKGYESFVGMHPIPVLHGLTVGELALMINGEGWLSGGVKCDLTVVEMQGWQHGDEYRLPVKPSPNLPDYQSVRLYPSLCFFEGTAVSVGRGTPFPFTVIGYPDSKGGEFTFTPKSLLGFDTNPMYKDRVCYGDDLRALPFEGGLSLSFVTDFYRRMGSDEKAFFTRPQTFDLLAGSDELRQQIIAGMTDEAIRATWQADLDAYRALREKYLLY